MTVRAKWIALLLLLVIWTGLGAWLLMDTNEPQRVPLKFIAGQSGVGGTRGHGNAATRIDLALLMAQRQKGDNAFMAPKNIFRPLKIERQSAAVSSLPRKEPAPRVSALPTPPAPAAPAAPVAPSDPTPPPSPLAMAMPPVSAPLPPPGPTPEELARQAGRQELSQYRYLGYLTRAGMDEAFLSKGKDLHIVKAGETIDQRVLVKAITPSGVTLQETASQVEQTVALVP